MSASFHYEEERPSTVLHSSLPSVVCSRPATVPYLTQPIDEFDSSLMTIHSHTVKDMYGAFQNASCDERVTLDSHQGSALQSTRSFVDLSNQISQPSDSDQSYFSWSLYQKQGVAPQGESIALRLPPLAVTNEEHRDQYSPPSSVTWDPRFVAGYQDYQYRPSGDDPTVHTLSNSLLLYQPTPASGSSNQHTPPLSRSPHPFESAALPSHSSIIESGIYDPEAGFCPAYFDELTSAYSSQLTHAFHDEHYTSTYTSTTHSGEDLYHALSVSGALQDTHQAYLKMHEKSSAIERGFNSAVIADNTYESRASPVQVVDVATPPSAEYLSIESLISTPPTFSKAMPQLPAITFPSPAPDPSSPTTSSDSASTVDSDEQEKFQRRHVQYCPSCQRTFCKQSALHRHQESVHGRKEAGLLLRREIKWYEAPALMDMVLRKQIKDKSLRLTLREGVNKYRREKEGNTGVEEDKYAKAFRDYAKSWLRESTCEKCGTVFSRRDAADRNHRCVRA